MLKLPTLVSTVMSSYNSEKTISASIESILNQSYKNIELLIIDDCSTDNSYEILKEYELNYDSINVFRNNKNIGLTKSLNIILKKTKGKFIARQDADDTSRKFRFENQLNFMNKFRLDACTTKAEIIQNNKIIPNLSYYLPNRMIINFKNPFIHGSLMIRNDVIKNLNYYDERFYYAQDYKLMRDLIYSNYKIKIINQTLYNLNMENNISSKFKNEQAYFANCVKNNIIPEPSKYTK